MRYGIMINLDYENHDDEIVISLFQRIRQSLESHGFRLDGRVFTTSLAEDEATALARLVLDELEARQAMSGTSIYAYIKTFYGFDIGRVKNLLLPDANAVAVEEYARDDAAEGHYLQAC